MICSNHSIERTRERSGFKGKTAIRFLHNALERGLPPEAFYRKEKEYLESIGRDGCRTIVYNGYCFIVSRTNICVTMFELPKWFRVPRKKTETT